LELIIAALPIFFFLFSLFEAQKTSNVIGYGNHLDRLPKYWIRVEPKEEKEDGLFKLEYLSESAFDLERYRNRVSYVYSKGL